MKTRGIIEDPKVRTPYGMKWRVDLKINGRRLVVRACSPQEAVFIRYRIELLLGKSRRRGNHNWSAFCFPNKVDISEVENGYLTLCGRTFKLKDPWTAEKGYNFMSGSWFSFCKRPPHCCLVGQDPEHPSKIRRVPLVSVVGPVSECKLSTRLVAQE